MQIEILDIELDDANAPEAARHGVTTREIEQVFQNEPLFFPNKRGRRSQLVMIGRTFGGRLLTVPLAETPQPGLWRPATAFDSSRSEAARYRQAGGG